MYAISCVRALVVPMLPNLPDDSEEWDYQYWLCPHGPMNILSQTFMVEKDDIMMHCMLLYTDQSAYSNPTQHENVFFQTETQHWHRNVLVMWANHRWPWELILDPHILQPILFSY